MIRAAIVGCGKMADQHAMQIRKIPRAKLVATCDAEPLMAKQIAERFNIPAWFTDVEEMLESVRPDVVHVTTPPQSHLEIGKKCVRAGVSAYIEKPFTLNTADAEELINLAEASGVKLTVGHNGQFTHAMNQMRRLVADGFLGGRPVHMESLYCYEFGDAAYAKALLGDKDHWARKLPGSLLQNIMSHGISRIAEFMTGDGLVVLAHGFSSPFLQGIGQGDIVDELRLIVRDGNATTAHFTFSSQICPTQHQFRVYGPHRSLVVDDDHQVLLRLENKQYKSYVRYFVPPATFAKQYIGNLTRNMWRFAKNEFHLPNEAGLLTLITSFYESVAEGVPLPIPYQEILLTSRIIDAALDQIGTVSSPAERAESNPMQAAS
ncbi:MAG: Gfo/Idh/MocA family oxidoreductase [Bryobacterales bacterium]|nr:Gfo/Idh/MocA family oxidoreductase [Bryobacterales bacterium]